MQQQLAAVEREDLIHKLGFLPPLLPPFSLSSPLFPLSWPGKGRVEPPPPLTKPVRSWGNIPLFMSRA